MHAPLAPISTDPLGVVIYDLREKAGGRQQVGAAMLKAVFLNRPWIEVPAIIRFKDLQERDFTVALADAGGAHSETQYVVLLDHYDQKLHIFFTKSNGLDWPMIAAFVHELGLKAPFAEQTPLELFESAVA